MSGRDDRARHPARQPEQQVRVRADAAEEVGLLGQRDAVQVPDEVGEQLQVQVRLPAAVDLRRAEPRDHVALAHLAGRQRLGVQVPVQRPEIAVADSPAARRSRRAGPGSPAARPRRRTARTRAHPRARRCRPPCGACASARPGSGTRARCRSRAARRSGRSRARRQAASRRPDRAPARPPGRRPSPGARRRAPAAGGCARAFGLASYPHASRKRKCASCGSSPSSRASTSVTPAWLTSR